VAHGSLRLTLCEENTMEEVEYMLDAIPQVVTYLRNMSPVWKELERGEKQFML
jgi:cysteine desulfurase